MSANTVAFHAGLDLLDDLTKRVTGDCKLHKQAPIANTSATGDNHAAAEHSRSTGSSSSSSSSSHGGGSSAHKPMDCSWALEVCAVLAMCSVRQKWLALT
jgi:hypothetical protein